MKRLGMVEKILFALTTLGGLLTVAALALFALASSGLASDLLRSAAGGVLGLTSVMLLTRSPRSGRRVAALLLLASVVGILTFVLMKVVLLFGSPPAAVEKGGGGIGFTASLLSWIVGASLVRLLGLNVLGPREPQPSRRRS